MDAVVVLGRFEVGDGPFPIMGSGHGYGHVDMMAAESTESVIDLQEISIKHRQSRTRSTYLSLRGHGVLGMLQDDFVVWDEVE
jgi:hypothetical protein